MSTELTRRGFVGALLATAAAPHLLPATPAPDAVRERRASDAELLAILDRPLAQAHFFEFCEACQCAACTEVRSQPYQCLSCGFEGTPTVFPCTCGRDWTARLERLEEELRDPAAWAADFGHSGAHGRARSRAAIKRDLRAERADGPPAPCAPPICAHLMRECPVCGDSGDLGEPFAFGGTGKGEVATMLRDLRSALLARSAR